MTDIWDAEEPGMVDRGDPICPVLWKSRDQTDLRVISKNGGDFEKSVAIVLSDKIPHIVGFVNCFLLAPEVYLPCSLLPCFQGMVGNSKKKVHNPM